MDYYKILGISPKATEEEIKSAYKKLAKQYHPDKNPDSTEMFQKINEAYHVLSEPDKRKRYDAGMWEFDQPNSDADGGHESFTGGGFMPENFDDILRNLFGDGDFGRRMRSSVKPIILEVHFTLEDLSCKASKEIFYTRQKSCDSCSGTGASTFDDVIECPACKGTGRQMKIGRIGQGFIQQFVTTCEVCHGRRKIAKNACKVCHGKGSVDTKSSVVVDLDGSIADGHHVVFSGEGNYSPDGPPGDVVVIFKEEPHPIFKRELDHPLDLYALVDVPLMEALTGYTLKLKRLNDTFLIDHIDTVIKPYDVRQFAGEGLGSTTTVGDLYIQFRVIFPDKVDPSRKATIVAALSDPSQPYQPIKVTSTDKHGDSSVKHQQTTPFVRGESTPFTTMEHQAKTEPHPQPPREQATAGPSTFHSHPTFAEKFNKFWHQFTGGSGTTGSSATNKSHD